ncbi:hypothetical protein IEO21_06565 [Rhodonia placenta]|uniref:Uncharacterized protein n=1 Tax=Rhodonia placenta TaxID=104341 RepID=A0A8H7NZU3_9APHY|nr:hypothetical protein IEO21_06565 [Postia placenta]
MSGTGNTGNNNTGNELGRTWGDKLKVSDRKLQRGAWNTIEGAGDSLRGGMMDFADSATGTGGHHTETDVGAQKTQTGIAEMKGSGTAGTAPQTAGARGTATTTGSAPPLPARGGAGIHSNNAATTAGSTTGPVP